MMKTYNKGSNCDKSWRAWYGILITLFHIFLFYVGISRYLSFKSQAFDPKFGANWDPSGLNLVLSMLIGALACFCLFLISNITRTSNYANEGTQIGRDTTNYQLNSPVSDWKSAVPLLPTTVHTGNIPPHVCGSQGHGGGSEDEQVSNIAGGEESIPVPNYDSWSGRSGTNNDMTGAHMGIQQFKYTTDGKHLSLNKSVHLLWKRVKRHFMPYANMLHLFTAYCLLLPIPIVHAQQVFHKALPSDWIWHSDMDVIFGTYSQPGSTEGAMKPIDTAMTPSPQVDIAYSTWDNLRSISPEFFNLILAYMLVSLRYPSVFWYTNRTFSFIFSLLLFLTGLHALIEYNAASILTKFIWNCESSGFPLSLSTAPLLKPGTTMSDQKAPDELQLNDPPLRRSFGPLALTFTSNILFICVFLSVFEYGYLQFIRNLLAYRHYLVNPSNSARFAAVTDPYGNGDRGAFPLLNGNGPTESINSGPNGLSKPNCLGSPSMPMKQKNNHHGTDILHPTLRPCLHNHAPYLVCFLGTICLIGLKLPLMWDCFRIYRVHKHPIMLASPITGIVLIGAWLIAWFAFALKPAWKFQVNLSLPAFSAPLASINPMLTFQPSLNGGANGQMMGSLLRSSSVMGNYGDNGSKIYSPYPSFSPYPPSFPPATNPGQLDDLSTHRAGIPSSPIYACYHDMLGNACTFPNPHMVHVSSGPNDGCGLMSGTSVGARTAEYGSADTEVSSGRQSGNHYVCLQSALGSGKAENSLHGAETFGLAARYAFQNSQSASPLPSTQIQAPPQFNMKLISNGVGNNSLYSSSNGMEDDRSSTNTVQPNNYRQKSMPPGETRHNNSLGVYTLNKFDNHLSTFNSPISVTGSCSGERAKENTSNAGACSLELPPHLLSTDCVDVSHIKSNLSPTNTAPNIPRVAFRDNVDMIAHTSSKNTDQSSQNTSSNDSGIDNLRAEKPTSSISSIPDNSGTYDNTFIGHCLNARVIGGKNIDLTATGLGQQMCNSIHSACQKSSTGLMKESASSSSESRSSDALTELLATALQGRSDIEMIGDVNNSFQSSTTETFPQFLSVDEQKEVRLCSQV